MSQERGKEEGKKKTDLAKKNEGGKIQWFGREEGELWRAERNTAYSSSSRFCLRYRTMSIKENGGRESIRGGKEGRKSKKKRPAPKGI